MASQAEGRFNKLFSSNSWNGRKSIFHRRSLSKLYPFDPVFLRDTRSHLSPQLDVFCFGSGDRWPIAVDQRTSDRKVVLQVHQRWVWTVFAKYLNSLMRRFAASTIHRILVTHLDWFDSCVVNCRRWSRKAGMTISKLRLCITPMASQNPLSTTTISF